MICVYFLNNLKDFKVYNNYKINGYDDKIKDLRKNQLIIHLGTSNESIVKFINSELFKPVYFNNYYTPKVYTTSNKRIKKIVNQKEAYDRINNLVSGRLNTKQKLDSYYGRNLFIDITDKLGIEVESLMTKSNIGRINNFIDTIKFNNIKSYKNVVLLFNLDSDVLLRNEISNLSVNKNPISFIISIIKRNIRFSLENDQDVTMIFYSPKANTFFKISLKDPNIWDTLKKNRNIIINRIEGILDRSYGIQSTIDLEKEIVEEVPKDKETSNVSKMNNNIMGLTPTKEVKVDNNIPEITKTDKSKIKKNNKQIEIDNRVDELVANIKFKVLNGYIDEESSNKLKEKISNKIIDNPDLLNQDIDIDTSINILLQDDDINADILNAINITTTGKTNVKRANANQYLRSKQEEVLSSSEMVKQAVEKAKSKTIDVTYIDSIDSINEEVNKSLSINDFDDSYMEKQFENDFVNILKTFNDDEEISVFINKLDVTDTSDHQTYKQTVNIQFKDDMNNSHTVKMDMPKIYDGKYMKVNGSKKIIVKQLMMLPIVKTKPNEVWITTNYNKLIIERFGRKNTLNSDYLNKLFNKVNLADYIIDGNKFAYKRGNSVAANSKFNVSIDYTTISEQIVTLNINKDRFIFNQKLLLNTIESDDKLNDIKFDNNKYFPVGYTSNKNSIYLIKYEDNILYTINKNGEIINLEISLLDYVIQSIKEITDSSIDKAIPPTVKSNQSLTYSRVKIINKHVPMIILLSFENGLIDILNRYDVSYEFVSKDKKVNILDNKNKIKFNDGFLIYDSSKLRNILLLAGLNSIDTSVYTFDEMNTKEPYLEYFNNEFNSRNVSKGIHNALTLCIDPITKEVLEDLKQPTNIIDLLLYANTMLEDLTSKSFNDMSIYRIRGAEQVNAIAYKIIAESYKNYKDSMNNRNPVKISVPQDALIKKLMETSTIDESSDLNPSLEIDKQTSVTYRGPTGRNNSDSYTPEIRGYDKSMEGFLAITSPDSSTIGVVRQLSYDAGITGTRGYIDVDRDKNNSTALLSPLELMSPYTSKYADPPRKHSMRFI